MREELFLIIVMLAVLAIGSILTKNDRKWSVSILLAAAVIGSLAAGMGLRFREIVEGTFGFLDSGMVIFSATVFVWALHKSGLFEQWFAHILTIKNQLLKAICMMFFLALPGALTGLASISVITTGKILGEHLKKTGIKQGKIAQIIAVGSFLGMVLPPNCMPLMLASNGAGSVLPTPSVGVFFPLLLVSLPAFLLYTWMVRGDLTAGGTAAGENDMKKTGTRLVYVPLIVVAIMLVFECTMPSVLSFGGQTVIYVAGLILALILNHKTIGGVKGCFNILSDGMMQALVPVSMMFAIGCFVEVTSMVGIRGYYSVLILPFEEGGYVGAMLIMTAILVALGFIFFAALPGFLATYAVFPIQWLASAVTLTGIGSAYSTVYLLAIRGGLTDQVKKELQLEEATWKDVMKGAALPVVLVLILGVLCICFSDSLSWLIV